MLPRCLPGSHPQLAIEATLYWQPMEGAVSTGPHEDDGCIHCTYTAPQAGFYRLDVTSHGVHIAGSPFSVKVSVHRSYAACHDPLHSLQRNALYMRNECSCLALEPGFDKLDISSSGIDIAKSPCLG